MMQGTQKRSAAIEKSADCQSEPPPPGDSGSAEANGLRPLSLAQLLLRREQLSPKWSVKLSNTSPCLVTANQRVQVVKRMERMERKAETR